MQVHGVVCVPETARGLSVAYGLPPLHLLSEHAAWRFMGVTMPRPQFKLISVNPCLTVGPMLQKQLNSSQVPSPSPAQHFVVGGSNFPSVKITCGIVYAHKPHPLTRKFIRKANNHDPHHSVL